MMAIAVRKAAEGSADRIKTRKQKNRFFSPRVPHDQQGGRRNSEKLVKVSQL